jgi:hypothetical protein
MAQVALLWPDLWSRALREVMRELLDTVDGATQVEDGSRLADRGRDGRAVLVGDAELGGIATKCGIAFVEGSEPLPVRPGGVVAWCGRGDAESALRQWFLHSIE